MKDRWPLYKKYLPVLNLETVPMPSSKMIKSLSGQISDKDIPVLASAITGRADYLVTGDKKDFSKPKTEGKYPFSILSPSEFLKIILPAILKEIEQN